MKRLFTSQIVDKEVATKYCKKKKRKSVAMANTEDEYYQDTWNPNLA